ncbi:MAG: hypothetical protein AAGD86_06360, partial [Pseudomonadota bacterium]
ATADPLRLDTGEAALKLWQVGGGRPNAVVYFGGNAEDVSTSVDELGAALPEHALYAVHYRGYGGSSGTPSEQGLYHDALVVFDYVAERHETVAVIGRSLGSGVATKVAVERDVERLVLVTPFDSISRLAQARFPWLPIGLLLKHRFDSLGRAAAVHCPTLVIVATDDEVIPRKHTDALVSALNNTAPTVVELHGEGHNTVSAAPRYATALADFFSSAPR